MKLSLDKLLVSSLIIFSITFSGAANSTDISLAADSLLASKALWKEASDQSTSNQQLAAKPTDTPINARMLELNEHALKSLLNSDVFNSKNQNSNTLAARSLNSQNTISLPLPDGSDVRLKITSTEVMSAALALEFPEIKTWKVSGVSEDITGVIDFTHLGFHAMLSMPDGDTVFIEPNHLVATQVMDTELSEKGQYLSLSKRENIYSFKSEFSCGVDSHSPLNFSPVANKSIASSSLAEKLQARPAAELITYRLAVATTGEYTRFHGGTVSSALSAIATTISRINEIYERDLGIRFELIDDQREIIYLNPNTDPYTNNDVVELIKENKQNLSNSGVLNTSKFDIGHVFGAGNVGGLAQVGSVCNNNFKAQGATGISQPKGEAFALDYVAHELGHQLGGTHTFNSTCGGGDQRSAETAVEPGSGSTILSYAGICGSNNIELSVDDYFHVVSIAQIREFTREDNGSGCGDLSNSNNENPTVNAGNDFSVPARTPLVFKASGADADNDSLSYTWEQSDAGRASNVNVDSGDNALFRSRPPSRSATRFIPQLSSLFSSTASKGELLPVTERSMEMVVTVRDDKGGLEADLLNLNVHDTGATFRVTSHTSNQNLKRGEEETIRWDVAGTNASPISCATVDIGLATDDGEGIDIVNTANDGQQKIIIPSNAPDMRNARFIVSCDSSDLDSGFFNVSSGCLTIGDSSNPCSNKSSSGGGSIGLFILSFFSILLWRRKFITSN